ncbi:MAG: AarF/ABC1/UbiB kinase family protein [Chloroflexi bacterium]|nr:AarF/ABC1/UbiB kinase family protein [Chloroflexota bacterium]
MGTRRRDVYLRRSRQIANVLARHGLGYLVGVLGLERFTPFHKGLFGHPVRPEPYTRPEHVRMALGELGATFIKLGQLLSTRADLLPPEYQAELARLQDAAPPVPTAIVRDTVVAELGRPIEAIFATFEPTPLAAASIGQVHAATLLSGREVVVKVRRPDVVEEVEVDLDILQNLAAVASRRWEFASQYDLVGLAQEFAQTLRNELDYLHEGRSAERFAASFARDPAIHIPPVFWEQTTSRVLTLERIRGIKISDLAALDAAHIDRQRLAEQATRIYLKMVFEDGFFHADPHPGNIFVEPDGRIGLIDFGMVGTVDARTREQLVDVLLAVTTRDADRLVDTLLELGVVRRRVNRDLLQRDLEHMVSRYYGRTLGEVPLGQLLTDALGVIRRHRLQLPPNLALLLKTMVMSEGLGEQLDPSFNLTTMLAPYAERLVLRQYSPLLWAGRLRQASLDAARLGVEMPQQLRRIIGELERGGLEVGMRPTGFEPLIRRFERLANRIVLGIIAASFVNGLAVLMSVYRPPGWEEWAGTVFAAGFAFAGALGAYLAWSILRSGRS